MKTRMQWSNGGIALILGIQVAWIVARPLHEHSYANWAPFHEHATYTVHAVVDGHLLTPAEVRERYGCYAHFYDVDRQQDWQLNRMSHVLHWIRRVEEHRSEQAEITVHYRINGGAEETWQWP